MLSTEISSGISKPSVTETTRIETPKKTIPCSTQTISEHEVQAVVAVLKGDWLTQGPTIAQFEQGLRTYTGANYAVAVSNATAALHLACIALDFKPGDILWTCPNSFVASSNCALYCGGKVDFVDIDPETLNLDVAKLERKLEEAKVEKCLPAILVPVHFSGRSCDMEKISQLSKKYGFRIVEDASHALSGTYNGKKVGSGLYSDFTIFSFHAVKPVTTAEGGALLTNNTELYRKLLLLRTHGITRDVELFESTNEGPWYYEQLDLGFNYRLTDMQAALGIVQMGKLDSFLRKRRDLAERYFEKLATLPLILPLKDEDSVQSAWHLFVIQLEGEGTEERRKKIFNYLRSEKIAVNVHYIPIHTQPFYKRLGFKVGDFPHSEKYYQRAISIPLYPNLIFEEQDYVIEKIKSALELYPA